MDILVQEPDASVTDRQINELVEVMSRLGRVFKSQLRSSDLSVPHWGMLIALHVMTKRSGSVHPGELAERCCLSSPAVTAALDELVDRGYCARTHSEQDRRKVLVRTTAAGDAATAEVVAGIGHGLRAMLHDWDAPRISQLLAALQDLDQAVDAYLVRSKS